MVKDRVERMDTIRGSESYREVAPFHPTKRVCWTAILVGALVAVGLGFLLNLFGIAIGLSALTVNKEGAQVLAIGGLVGMAIGMIAAMVVAGYAAGYLGRKLCPRRNLGILYGFLTWTVALFLSAALASHFSDYVDNYSYNLSNHHGASYAATNSNKNNSPDALTVQKADGITDGSSPNNSSNPAVTNISTDSLAITSWIVFALFIVGVISTCIGATWGMACRRDD